MIPEIMTYKTAKISWNGTMEKRRNFTPVQKAKTVDIKISIDGKGESLDNQRIGRFWRAYKWQ